MIKTRIEWKRGKGGYILTIDFAGRDLEAVRDSCSRPWTYTTSKNARKGRTGETAHESTYTSCSQHPLVNWYHKIALLRMQCGQDERGGVVVGKLQRARGARLSALRSKRGLSPALRTLWEVVAFHRISQNTATPHKQLFNF